jgi:hypothetical protein
MIPVAAGFAWLYTDPAHDGRKRIIHQDLLKSPMHIARLS